MDGSGNGQPPTKSEFFEAMGQLRNSIDERFLGLDERLQALKEYVDERTHDAETRLLRGFANFAGTFEVRMKKMSADISNINTATDTRLAIIEERLAEVERKVLEKGL